MTLERLSRVERRQQTRVGLVAAARPVFLRRGFHAASLEEIVADAGYTKGAVYSNFDGKDDLFLAVLADHYESQTRRYREIVIEGGSLEESYRAIARVFVRTLERDPEWMTLVSEFVSHASRDESLRARVAAVRDRFLETIAELIDELGTRHGVRYRVPSKQVALGSSAVMRGLALERLLHPEQLSLEQFEEIHTAYMLGITDR